MAEGNSKEDIRPGDKVPSENTVDKIKGYALGVGISLVAAYIILGFATDDWNPLDGYDFSNIDTEPEEAPDVEKNEETIVNTTDSVEQNAPIEEESVNDDETPADTATAAAATAPCAADEVVEKTSETACVALSDEEIVATADSSCDGIIALTREALWGNAGAVTPEMVAEIENPFVKSVYQALLDGDRSALTTALTNLYAENGAFIPENASGVLDGLKDSIIIYDGDQIRIDENGWTLVRNGGEEIALVDCEGKLLNVDERMSDTGTCGDTTPQVTRGNAAPVIAVTELPMEDIEPVEVPCKIVPTEIERGIDGRPTGRILSINVFEDLNNDGDFKDAGELVARKVDPREYFAEHPDRLPRGIEEYRGHYYDMRAHAAYEVYVQNHPMLRQRG